MAIRIVNCDRDNSPGNVNPKFHRPDSTVIPHWNQEVCNVPRSEYYLTPEVSEWAVIGAVVAGKPCPAGYLIRKDETTYTDRVCKVKSAEERIMSDVWEIVTRALVYTPETKGRRQGEYGPVQESDYIWVHVGVSGNYLFSGAATVDAPADIIARWETMEADRIEREETAQREATARAIRQQVTSGKVVRVNRGRKVVKGTVGKVFWEGNNGYGATVGLALTPRTGPKVGRNGRTYESFLDVVFVAATNVDVVGWESDDAMATALATWKALA